VVNILRDIAKLTPQKALVYSLLLAIGWLSSQMESLQIKDDGKSEKNDKAIAKKDAKIDSLQAVIVFIKTECSNKIEAKDQETIKDLKERIALQQKVNIKAGEAERKVDVVVQQVETKINRLIPEKEEKQNDK